MLINEGNTGSFNVYDTITTSGGLVSEGDLINITGERGKFRFVKFVQNTDIDKEWIDCIHVKKDSYHSFRPNRIKV